MNKEERLPVPNGISPFERIRRTNAAGAEYWSSRDFAQVLGYSDYRNFEQAMKRAKAACFNSGQPLEDHFGEITEMVLDHVGSTYADRSREEQVPCGCNQLSLVGGETNAEADRPE